MMQQLLTAKLRFPGFVGEWEMVKMGTICKLQGGYAFESSQYKKNGIPIIRISNISNKNNYIELKEVIYYEKIENDSNFILKNGDLLIAMSGATIGKSSIYNLNEIGYLNQRVGKFNPVGSKIDYQFLIQFVFSNKFKEKMNEILVAGAQPNFSSSDIEKFNLIIPNLKEQKKIAQFLTAMDAEIEILQTQLTQLQTQKQGLMQVLLTGEIRVKV
jgi:type I restriction enzyme S subunit